MICVECWNIWKDLKIFPNKTKEEKFPAKSKFNIHPTVNSSSSIPLEDINTRCDFFLTHIYLRNISTHHTIKHNSALNFRGILLSFFIIWIWIFHVSLLSSSIADSNASLVNSISVIVLFMRTRTIHGNNKSHFLVTWIKCEVIISFIYFIQFLSLSFSFCVLHSPCSSCGDGIFKEIEIKKNGENSCKNGIF